MSTIKSAKSAEIAELVKRLISAPAIDAARIAAQIADRIKAIPATGESESTIEARARGAVSEAVRGKAVPLSVEGKDEASEVTLPSDQQDKEVRNEAERGTC